MAAKRPPAANSASTLLSKFNLYENSCDFRFGPCAISDRCAGDVHHFRVTECVVVEQHRYPAMPTATVGMVFFVCVCACGIDVIVGMKTERWSDDGHFGFMCNDYGRLYVVEKERKRCYVFCNQLLPSCVLLGIFACAENFQLRLCQSSQQTRKHSTVLIRI